jgi:hypothetical protein
MKTNHWSKNFVIVSALLLAGGATTVAQDAAMPATAPSATTAAPHLSYGVSQILQLGQAKLGDDTIIAYIRNSGSSYRLNADQIIYLRQQGLSEAVVTAMLNQPRTGVVAGAPATPAPAPPPVAASSYAGPAGQVSTATVAPSVTYVQTAPSAYYYADPYYYSYPYYYNPGYVWFPSVSLGWGWGWGWGWRGGGYWHGGGWHGGYGGGWHGGGFARGGHGGGRR